MIIHSECLEAMRNMRDNSVTAIVTDPPYALEFMGKGWDRVLPDVDVWKEAFRVLKPGGMALVFGGTRTFHRLTCSLEDAGFQIRDVMCWLYGSGFPKSHNVANSIDKKFGHGPRGRAIPSAGTVQVSTGKPLTPNPVGEYEARSPEGEPWLGYGTALKPAWEPIVVAMKPLDGTFAANALKHGVAGINVDGCRVGPGHDNGHGRTGEASAERRYNERGAVNIAATPGPRGGCPTGRWPANVVMDEEAGALLDEQSGNRPGAPLSAKGFKGPPSKNINVGGGQINAVYGDQGGASRFFFAAHENLEEWLDRNLNLSSVSFARNGLSLQSKLAASALSDVATAALHGDRLASVSKAPSMNVTAIEFVRILKTVTLAIQTSENEFWQESLQGKPIQNQSPAVYVVQRGPTGTMTITISRWRSGGSADPITFSITQNSLEVGEKGSESSTTRFKYCAKASKKDRGPDNKHPTVKPTSLMRWLVRMVKMPSKTIVLDPFAGSGSTGVACALEGVEFIGIEREAEYVEIMERRIEAAQ